MKTRLGAAAIAALVVVALAGASGGFARSTAGTISIGALCDLSGPTSDIGTSYCNGEKAYVDWKNRRGGVKVGMYAGRGSARGRIRPSRSSGVERASATRGGGGAHGGRHS